MRKNKLQPFIVTYYKNNIKKTVCVKARDKRMAKHAAKRKMGDEINIVSALRWREHLNRVNRIASYS